MKFFTVEKIGPKQSLTPEGFLLCEDVPAARTGLMLYGPGEIENVTAKNGMIVIERTPEEVFRPETLASFAGKPVVDDHPDDPDTEGDVTPANWRELAMGVVMYPRRGVGAEDDLMLVDILVTDPNLIKEVRAGKREISCGYEAEYEQIEPGRGRQYNIIGNHFALVAQGRCGPRCSIRDRATLENSDMKFRDKKVSVFDRIMAAFKARDEEAFKAAMAEAPAELKETKDELPEASESGEHTHIHMHGSGDGKFADAGEFAEHVEKNEAEHKGFRDSLSKLHEHLGLTTDAAGALVKKDEGGGGEEGDKEIEGELKEEAPEGTGDDAVKVKDSRYLVDSFQEAVALAEILAPGIAIPSVDPKAPKRKTFDSLCAFRRDALTRAYADATMKPVLEEMNGGRPLTIPKMTCDAVRRTFGAAGAVKKRFNNGGNTVIQTGDGFSTGPAGPIKSIADLNKANRARFNKSA